MGYSLQIFANLTMTPDLESALRKFSLAAEVALGNALMEEARVIAGRAQSLAPRRTGELRKSAAVTGPYREGTRVTEVDVSFGGPEGTGNLGESNSIYVDYAVAVHEDLYVKHPEGQAKFLEHPVLEWARDAEARLAERVRSIAAGVL